MCWKKSGSGGSAVDHRHGGARIPPRLGARLPGRGESDDHAATTTRRADATAKTCVSNGSSAVVNPFADRRVSTVLHRVFQSLGEGVHRVADGFG